MKIIWFYKYVPEYNFDKHFHLDYVRDIKSMGLDIVVYGKNVEQGYPDLVEIPYDEDMEWNRLIKDLKADIAILNTKSRMFDHYSPHTKEAFGCWLPKGWGKSKKIPKIMIDEDRHYEYNNKWEKKSGIDLIFERHYSNYLRSLKFKPKIKTEWLPFSVDTKVFKPTGKERINKICFAGHFTEPYPERKLACDILDTNVDIFCHKEKINDDYIKCLQEYVCHLSGSSIYNISAAKNFEIMSSGSLLLTDRFPGIDELFPRDCYCSFKKDGSDIEEKAEIIFNDKDYVRETVEKGVQHIKTYHNNFIRTCQMLSSIKENLL